MSDVTRLIDSLAAGDTQAASELFPLIYDELRKLAAARMANEQPGQTLQATALVHEAYIRLVGGQCQPNWSGRGHFFAAAAAAMRRILVEHARSAARVKRGGDWRRVDFEGLDPATSITPDQLVALDEALERLSSVDTLAGELVKLRYFAGLSLDEAAESQGVSPATAYRHWAFARAWLSTELSRES